MTWRGWDTETQDGRIVLVSTDRASTAAVRSFADVCAWTWCAAAPRAVAWNLSFDASCLVGMMPRRYWAAAWSSVVVEHAGWRLRYVPARTLRIAPAHRPGAGVTIYDAYSLYQQSLRRAAIAAGLDDGKLDIPASWYRRMDVLAHDTGKRGALVHDYARRDAAVALALWERVRRMLSELGLAERDLRPVSPGYLAARYWRDRWPVGAKRRGPHGKMRRSAPFARIEYQHGREAYRGGRVEVWQRGRIGDWREHDLCSAYPWALARCADPRGLMPETITPDRGRWVAPEDARYGTVRCRLAIDPADVPRYPLIHRMGTLHYPTGVWEVPLTLPEYQDAEQRGYVERVYSGMVWCGEHRLWFPDVPDLYQLRRDRPDLKQALKLLLNSAYGKLAESTARWGRAQTVRVIDASSRHLPGGWYTRYRRPGVMAVPWVAAHVTALVRLRVADALALAPERVVSIATDSILWRGSEPVLGLSIGTALGDWGEASTGEDACVVGPGMGWYRSRGRERERTRGLRVTAGRLRRALEASAGMGRAPLAVGVIGPRGLGEAVSQRRSGAPGAWRRVVWRYDPRGDSKRVWPDLKGSLWSQRQTSRSIIAVWPDG